MAIPGLRATDDFTGEEFSPAQPQQRPRNWREGISLLMINGKAPMTALSTFMKRKPTDDPEFNWFEKVQPSRRLELNADIITTPASGTVETLTVLGEGTPVTEGGANQLKPDDVLYIEATGELVRVVVVNSDTSVDVARGFAGTTTATVTIATENPNMIVMGSAYREGAPRPEAVSFRPTRRFNYTQIFRDALSLSRTAMKTRLRTGPAVKEAKRETLELHSIAMEWATWLGVRSEDLTGAATPRRSTDGILQVISRDAPAENVINAASDPVFPVVGEVTTSVLEDLMERFFRYGSQEKVAFLGNKAALYIQRAVRLSTNGQFLINQGQKEFGMNVSRLVSPFGTLVMKTHPLFNLITDVPGTYTSLINDMIVLDMEGFTYRPLVDSDTKYLPDRQENGLDGMLSEYLTECGYQIEFPRNHFWVQGITSANAG